MRDPHDYLGPPVHGPGTVSVSSWVDPVQLVDVRGLEDVLQASAMYLRRTRRLTWTCYKRPRVSSPNESAQGRN